MIYIIYILLYLDLMKTCWNLYEDPYVFKLWSDFEISFYLHEKDIAFYVIPICFLISFSSAQLLEQCTEMTH